MLHTSPPNQASLRGVLNVLAQVCGVVPQDVASILRIDSSDLHNITYRGSAPLVGHKAADIVHRAVWGVVHHITAQSKHKREPVTMAWILLEVVAMQQALQQCTDGEPNGAAWALADALTVRKAVRHNQVRRPKRTFVQMDAVRSRVIESNRLPEMRDSATWLVDFLTQAHHTHQMTGYDGGVYADS